MLVTAPERERGVSALCIDYLVANTHSLGSRTANPRWLALAPMLCLLFFSFSEPNSHQRRKDLAASTATKYPLHRLLQNCVARMKPFKINTIEAQSLYRG